MIQWWTSVASISCFFDGTTALFKYTIQKGVIDVPSTAFFEISNHGPINEVNKCLSKLIEMILGSVEVTF
jgi:hypothetical protein